MSAPSPSVVPDAAEDPVPWMRMSKQDMLGHYRGLKRIRYERRFYDFLSPTGSIDRDKKWKKLRQLKVDPKLYHSLVATVQHMVERHGAQEPVYATHWYPPIVYDPEPPLNPRAQADLEEWELFKREHPKEAEDWEKAIAEREKKREKENEAVSKRFEERRNERKALAERIEDRENKRKNTQAEAIETIKPRYQNGSLVRDVGLEPRCRHEVQWNHCPQCRVYGRTPFLECVLKFTVGGDGGGTLVAAIKVARVSRGVRGCGIPQGLCARPWSPLSRSLELVAEFEVEGFSRAVRKTMAS
ncbi:hypothetical protein R1sor_010770 [Riccia sorocarpa]|uniref:Uncharacterized protein n=1 Tax=Riccia sorocarpa TaxID=122646 RepID=A0ABD3I519_9MARC